MPETQQETQPQAHLGALDLFDSWDDIIKRGLAPRVVERQQAEVVRDYFARLLAEGAAS